MIGFKNRVKIKRVSPGLLCKVIDRCTPLGLFLTKEGRKWVAVDNSTGDAWTVEADIILGYMEGHDFCLMADNDGGMMRHDEQCEGNHKGDEPYTIHDAVEFCQEMNEELIRDSGSTKEYLSQLRKDEKILDALMARLAQESINKEREVLPCVS